MLTVLSNQQIVVIHTLQFFQCFATALTSGITEDTADNQIEKSIASHVPTARDNIPPSQYPVMYIEFLVLWPSLLVWFIQLRVL